MNRQEAAAILRDNLYGFVGDDITEALYLAVEALEGPAPDPKTGLVPCGCGGKAGFHYSVIVDNDCYVECGICGEHSKVALCEEKARDAWNAALRSPDPDTGCPERSWIDPALSDRNYCKNCGRRLRIDTPPGNDSVRASTGFQRDGGDKTERWCNQRVHCGQEMPEGDQVCGYCRRQHGY